MTSPPVHSIIPVSSRSSHTPKKLNKQNIATAPVHNVPGKKSKSSETDNAKKTVHQKML